MNSTWNRLAARVEHALFAVTLVAIGYLYLGAILEQML
jgi:hypothetical protein